MRGFFAGLLAFAASAALTISLRNEWLPIRMVAPATGTISNSAQPDIGNNPSSLHSSHHDAVHHEQDSTSAPLEKSHAGQPPAQLPSWAEDAARPIPGPGRSDPKELPRSHETDAPSLRPVRPATSRRQPVADHSGRSEQAVQSTAMQIEEPLERSRQRVDMPESDHKVIEARQLIAERKFLPAQKILSQIYWDHPSQRNRIVEDLEANARRIFFEPQLHFIEPHTVQPGDQLQQVAKKYKVTWQYLAKLNRTPPGNIRPDQKLKVIRGPFSAHVNLGSFLLTVHLQGYFVRQFQVGIGKDSSSPRGKFTVINKVENPQYTDPEGRVMSGNNPKNPLGERWIDLGNSYGIHGTIDPESIGKAESRGCIRLRPDDVIEVYDFLVTGSEVVIED